MKRIFTLLFFTSTLYTAANAQTATPGPAEKKMTDSVCNAVNKLDLSKITTKDEAVAAYTQCIGQYADILQAMAEEKHADMSNTDDMKKVGVVLAKDLIAMKCSNFMKLENIIAQQKVRALENTSSGEFRRIETKGFNYIVISDNGNEKSFIWLQQFPGSEKFMNNTLNLAGKKLKISWQELEVYLPQAKGYYKVKEITAIDFL